MKHQIKPAALRRIEHHRAVGDHLVLVTASLDVYVQHIGTALGFDHILSTKAAWTAHNTLSGDIDGPNLKGREKVTAVQKWLSENQSFRINNADQVENLTVYSDHHSDLPLMLFAGKAIAVDPTPELTHLARKHKFAIERWKATWIERWKAT
jgi:HAD superfamily phosphoserine phosphatase-like hydrolase